MNAIDWKAIPRQALIDAIRNSSANSGLSNLSRQDKVDLIAAARRIMAGGHAEDFRRQLDQEIQFRCSQKKRAVG